MLCQHKFLPRLLSIWLSLFLDMFLQILETFIRNKIRHIWPQFCFTSLVPVDIWTSSTLPPPLLTQETEEEEPEVTDLAALPMSTNPGGCDIDGEFYMDGMKVPSDSDNPCDLCYCIKNHTACVMQECTLKVEGCTPIYVDGVCCPVKYICGEW